MVCGRESRGIPAAHKELRSRPEAQRARKGGMRRGTGPPWRELRPSVSAGTQGKVGRRGGHTRQRRSHHHTAQRAAARTSSPWAPPRVAPAHPSLLHCVVRVRSHVMRARSAVRYFISIQIRTFTYLEVLLRTRMCARRSASARASVANGRAVARTPGALATPSRFAGCSATLARKDEVDAVP